MYETYAARGKPTFTTTKATLLAATMLWGLTLPATAQTQSSSNNAAASDADLRAQVQALQEEVRQLKTRQDEDDHWLDKRRAQQHKKMTDDILAAAQKRIDDVTSADLTAGYNGKHFFLASSDHNFLMNIGGQLDLRYIYNHSDQNDSGNDENVSGFQVRRAKIGFSGHIFDPALTYKVKGAFNRNGGDFELEDAWIAYDLTDSLQLKGGQFTEPFLREFMVSSTVQQAVDRSLVTNYLTGEFTKGVYGYYHTDRFHTWLGVTGGPGSADTDFNNNAWEYAAVGRVEYLLMGDFKEFHDFAAFSGQPTGLMLGAGVNYAKGAHGPGIHTADALKYTADLSMKLGAGVNAFVALEGQHISDNGDPLVGQADQIGGLAQIGKFIIPDKLDVFTRYEYMDLDGVSLSNSSATTTALVGGDTINLVTVGANYYFKKQAAKLSLDVIYSLDDLPIGSSGLGLAPAMGKGETAVRLQFQLLF